jgi:hypothetical protein
VRHSRSRGPRSGVVRGLWAGHREVSHVQVAAVQAMTLWPGFKLALVGIGVILVLLFLAPKFCGPSGADTVTRENEEILRGRMHDALVREVAAKEKAERALRARGLAARAVADTSTDLPSKILFLQQSCDAFQEEAETCQERAAVLQVRLDTLESALRRQIGVTGCKVLFLDCPSRGVLFVGGLAIGALTGIVLTHSLTQ